jgi:geranylgeranyl diphosphate synthase type II
VSEFGIDRARELAAESHRMAREALADAAAVRSVGGGAALGGTTDELGQIADFIYTRTS